MEGGLFGQCCSEIEGGGTLCELGSFEALCSEDVSVGRHRDSFSGSFEFPCGCISVDSQDVSGGIVSIGV